MAHQNVTIRLVLDENKPYFAGESITGKVLLACPRPVSPHGIRLIWAGGVTIRPTPQDQENYLYFRRNYAISNDKLDGKKVSNGMAYKSSSFVENYDTSIPLLFVMEQSVTYSFAFEVQVPTDIPLPSSTEAETSMLGGKIVYTIECCLDMLMDDPAPIRSHTMVTVLEHMDVRLPEYTVPRTEESVYALWLPNTPKTSPCNYRTAMRATLPSQATSRGSQVNIVIHVWHSIEFQRPKGVTVSLIRVRHLHYHGSAYAFPDENILSMRADVDLKLDKKFVQTLHCTLPIRDDITPTIGDAAKLLEISYKIHIKVQLQEGTYQTLTGESQGFMYVEIPLLIGTVPLMIGKKMITPRKPLTTRAITSGSKKSDGSKDNDGGSVVSTELNKKSGFFGRKASTKQESSNEKKNGTLRKIFNFGGSRSRIKDDSSAATVVSSTHSNNHADDEPTHQHSEISSVKNQDQDQQGSFHNGSQHSQSISPPRIELDSVTSRMQDLFTPQNNNNNNNQEPVKITDSIVELKPDEKGDEVYDYELLASINRAKAEAAITTVTSPIDPTPTTSASNGMPPPSHTSTSTLPNNATMNETNGTPDRSLRQSVSVKEDDIFDNVNEGRPQSPMSVPTTVTSNGGNGGGGRGVRYHNIFESSDEEDYDDDDGVTGGNSNNEDEPQQPQATNGNGNMITHHSPFIDSSDDEENHHNDNNGDTSKNITNAPEKDGNDDETRIIKPTESEQLQMDNDSPNTLAYLQQQKGLPPSSPRQLQHQYSKQDNGHHSDTDSDDSDDSPLTLMMKQSRQRYQRQQH